MSVGEVIVSASASDSESSSSWIFTTMFRDLGALPEGTHPVSGNRLFAIRPDGDDGFVFYTRGADRPTTKFDAFMWKTVLAGADYLWRSLMQKVHDEVVRLGGKASVRDPQNIVCAWTDVSMGAWNPKAAGMPNWVDPAHQK